MKLPIVLCVLLLSIAACKRSTEFTIKPEIKKDVERRLGMHVNNISYKNELVAELTVNNKIVRTKTVSNILAFRSFHYWSGDTLKIIGGFGVMSGYGFIIKIHNGNASVSHLIFSEEEPRYSLTRKGKSQVRIEVPCPEWKVCISENPPKNSTATVYGFVQLKSNEFYELNGKKKDARTTDLEVYFVSRKSK